MSALDALTPRERLLLTAGAVALAALLLFRFAWMPIRNEAALLDEDMARYLTLSAIADRAAAPAAGPDRTDTTPAAQRITQSAASNGVALARLEPDGQRHRITLDGADFDSVILWIDALERQHALRLFDLEVNRRAEPGQVSARLTLEPLQ